MLPSDRIFRLAGALLLALAPAAVQAQAINCTLPQTIDRPRPERPGPGEVRRTRTTRYSLTLSWSPEHCRGNSDPDDDFQCGVPGNFGFVLHGLWPETDGRDWPQWCAPATLLSREEIRRNLCMTPSEQLLQHEWARHGTCMARRPESYFRQANRLYSAIRYPDMRNLSRQRLLTVGAFRTAFAAANRGIDASMIAINTKPGGWLNEVRICLGRTFRPQACPPAAHGAPDTTALRIWTGAVPQRY